MKLTKRINYILLPVIFSVFTLAGVVAYHQAKIQEKREQLSSLSRELRFVAQEFKLDQRAVHSTLWEVLNSATLINYTNAKDTEYQVFAIENQLINIINRARANLPNLELLQLIEESGEVLITVKDNDPFSEPDIDQELKSEINLKRGAQTGDLGIPDITAREYLYKTASGQFKYAIEQPFSPSLLVGDKNIKRDTGILRAIITSYAASLNEIAANLSKRFGDELKVDIRNTLSLTDGDRRKDDIIWKSLTGATMLQLQHRLFTVDVIYPDTLVWKRVKKEKLAIGLSVILLTVFSFLALQWLIRKQVVFPINQLVEQVRASRSTDSVILQPLQRNDEVSELNNAYLSLLKDVQELAANDQLTGLMNRATFLRQLRRQLQEVRQQRSKLALLYIDLDNFKRVNDHYGHATGDRLLVAFSNRLLGAIRPGGQFSSIGGDSLARLSGDEFVLMLTQINNIDAPRAVGQRILSLFEKGFELDGVSHNVQASIGITVSPMDGDRAEVLLRNADAAMYQAKNDGRNRYNFFSEKLSQEMLKRQKIEVALKQAIQTKNGFELLFMPIYRIEPYALIGAEVLLRCPALTDMRIGPDQFIPVAESTGQIKQIDLWVIENTFIELSRFCKENAFTGRFAINISAVELHNEVFPDQVAVLLKKYNIDPHRIELELTETSLVHDDAASITIMKKLRELGVSLALDDFGTGYTAFNQLNSYPVDCLKIDKSFVKDMHTDREKKLPMVYIILELAKLYELNVVAEGVETEEQFSYLKHIGCDQVQGYYFSKPLNRTDWIELFQAHCSQFGHTGDPE